MSIIDAYELEDIWDSLDWSLHQLQEENGTDDQGTPKHECEFITNPPKGSCSFHEKFWKAVDNLPPYLKSRYFGEQSSD